MSSGQAAVLPTPGLARGHAHAHAAGLTEHLSHSESQRIVVGYGFWIFLISDIILFAAFFATYAVLTDSTAGGPIGRDLFDMTLVAVETACLLTSSLFCGIAGIGAQARNSRLFHGAMAVTFVLGAAFLAIELHEFADMIEKGAGPQRSAFLSAFFALVGTHGLHVTFGILWLIVLMVQVSKTGLIRANQRRLTCLSLFWHFLDLVWIGVFTFVYLLGVLR